MCIRESIEERERQNLSRFALCSADSKGREKAELPCDMRTCFQRDVDRVIHAKAFRRLAQKTQVFLRPEGDHYRTRLTHTLEVMRIGRTIARGLKLNEDLTEAVTMAHDLGHTPFGHAGERALNELMEGGFKHNEQSLRVVQKLEKNGLGLNLSYEVEQGILCHTGDKEAEALECRLVRYADRIAYINADFDDAVRAHILKEEDLTPWIHDVLGATPRERIDTLVQDLILHSRDKVEMSPERSKAMLALRSFMFERVYVNPVAKSEEKKAQALLTFLFEGLVAQPDRLPHDFHVIGESEGWPRAAADYIAGMTDRYAVMRYNELTIPKGWSLVN